VLVHGRAIIEATPVNLGLTSEEGSESNTKFARNFYQHHTRKNSQQNTMSDLFLRLMDCSDPCILAPKPITKKSPIPMDMFQLIKRSEGGNDVNSFSESDSSPGGTESSQSDSESSSSDNEPPSSDTESMTDLSFNVSLFDIEYD
jgi:hypothetical protein